jgi:hypothetical protein
MPSPGNVLPLGSVVICKRGMRTLIGDKVTTDGASFVMRCPRGGEETVGVGASRELSVSFETRDEWLDPGVVGISSGLALESPSETI